MLPSAILHTGDHWTDSWDNYEMLKSIGILVKRVCSSCAFTVKNLKNGTPVEPGEEVKNENILFFYLP